MAASRVFDIITYNSFSKEKYGKKDISNLDGYIEFKDVNFKYNSKNLF